MGNVAVNPILPQVLIAGPSDHFDRAVEARNGVELKPETERLVQEEIQRGHFHSVDDLIVQAVYALREKSKIEQPPTAPSKPSKHLYDLLTQPPFAGSELNLERQKD